MPPRTPLLRIGLILSFFAIGCEQSAPPVEPENTITLSAAHGGALAEIAAGYLFTCALNRRGDPFCWGNDASGELGDGADAAPFKTTPSAVSGGLRLRDISAGGDPVFSPLVGGHACGITRGSRAAYCWGHGADGRLGNSATTDEPAPVAVVAPGTRWLTVSAGGNHTCGVDASNTAYCWGNGTFGQRGDGMTTVSATTPVAVSGGHAFVSVSSGGFHTCGVTSTGQGYCWGLGSNGQLGQGGAIGASSNMPVLVAGGLVFQSMAAGRFHTCGLTRTGQAHCWGFGLSGNLGNGTTNVIAQTTPVPVFGGLVFNQLVSGFGHTCGLTRRGASHCWGQGLNGERGDGFFVLIRSTPVAVLGGIRFSRLTAGGFHTCGSTNPGPAYCWGEGSNGGLGDGGTASRNVPTAVMYP